MLTKVASFGAAHKAAGPRWVRAASLLMPVPVLSG